MLLLVVVNAVTRGSESRGTQDHILLSQFLRLPQPGGPDPRIYIPQGQGGPRALGSFSVASYDSQGYGGGILSRLHKGKWATVSFIGLKRTKILPLLPACSLPRKRVCCFKRSKVNRIYFLVNVLLKKIGNCN
jgi:hypothetical protein